MCEHFTDCSLGSCCSTVGHCITASNSNLTCNDQPLFSFGMACNQNKECASRCCSLVSHVCSSHTHQCPQVTLMLTAVEYLVILMSLLGAGLLLGIVLCIVLKRRQRKREQAENFKAKPIDPQILERKVAPPEVAQTSSVVVIKQEEKQQNAH